MCYRYVIPLTRHYSYSRIAFDAQHLLSPHFMAETVSGDLENVVLDPILIFVGHMGVSGAAIAHV